jgi:hypothetical protein
LIGGACGDDDDDEWGLWWGGGGGGCIGCGGPQPGPPPPPPPPQQPPAQQPINFPNETLGLPNGFPTRPWGILPALFPSDLPCPAELSSLCGGIDAALGEGPDVPLNPNAQQILSQVGRTAGQLNNPCTIGLFYGTSAAGGAAGTVDATAAVATAEGWGIPATTGLSWLYRWNPARAAVFLGNGLQKAAGVVQSVCNWIGQANW